jgi:Raf kinase inhibitor-like YbhB/YbcL family protein
MALASVVLAACGGNAGGDPLPPPPEDVASIEVLAGRFTNGALIRPRYTCDGINLSPDLSWAGVPSDAVTLVIIVDDPAAPTGSFTHWLIYDLPVSVTELIEGIGGPFDVLQGVGGRHGRSDFGDMGYSGPCPPRGELHAYNIHIYAVDVELDLGRQAKRDRILEAMDGHVVGYGVFSTSYERQQLSEGGVAFNVTPTP